MKENKYDDNIFFQKYSQMSRSQQGLAGGKKVSDPGKKVNYYFSTRYIEISMTVAYSLRYERLKNLEFSVKNI